MHIKLALTLCSLLLTWPATRAAGETVADARLNGFWVINDEARTVVEKSAHADLTPKGRDVARQNAEHAAERLARHEPVSLAAATCGYIGPPFFVDTSEPWLLVVTDGAVLQAFERYQQSTRRFYMDGRPWPDLSKLPPSSTGYSVGHWEGKDLVIETRGLQSAGPPPHGGGLKGPKTVLVERASVAPDGDHLTWTFTWSDPELLAQPYSYSVLFDRQPSPTYALTQTCDPNQDPSKLIDTQEGLR